MAGLGRRSMGELEAAGAMHRRPRPRTGRHRHHRADPRAASASLTDGPFAETKESSSASTSSTSPTSTRRSAGRRRCRTSAYGSVEVRPLSADGAGRLTTRCRAPPRSPTGVERAYREEWTALLATLAGQVGGDIGLAEEAVAGRLRSPRPPSGRRRACPPGPAAWLTTVARRRAIDRAAPRPDPRRATRPALEHLERLMRDEQADTRGATSTAGPRAPSPTTGCG